MNSVRVPRWPLAVIGAPAAVAVWSGWVGLGTLCGFGPIHPLPGIWDSAHVNTAITLPVGVEAYGTYAMAAWLSPGTSGRARVFARWSAIGALVLGMLGQVAYHLLAAAHATRAPWPVVVLVSCLPVVTLGFGAVLAHLLHEPGETVPLAVSTPAPGTVPQAVAGETAESVPGTSPVPVPVTVPRTAAARPAPTRIDAKRKPDPAKVFAAELAAGQVPSLRAVKERCHVGTPRAREILAELVTVKEVPQAA